MELCRSCLQSPTCYIRNTVKTSADVLEGFESTMVKKS